MKHDTTKMAHEVEEVRGYSGYGDLTNYSPKSIWTVMEQIVLWLDHDEKLTRTEINPKVFTCLQDDSCHRAMSCDTNASSWVRFWFILMLLSTLSTTPIKWRRMRCKAIMNREYTEAWKETAMTYLKLLSGNPCNLSNGYRGLYPRSKGAGAWRWPPTST